MSKHTPGPWRMYKVDRNSYQIRGNLLGFPGAIIAVTSSYGYHAGAVFINPDARKANAHLMTAAPDLLEALEDLLPLWGREDVADTWSDVFEKAQKAIAKAKGQQP